MKNCHIPFLVVIFLGAFANISLAGTIWLIGLKAEPASIAIIAGLCATSIGGITGLLAQTNRPHHEPTSDPQKVIVENTVLDPVNTKENK